MNINEIDWRALINDRSEVNRKEERIKYLFIKIQIGVLYELELLLDPII